MRRNRIFLTEWPRPVPALGLGRFPQADPAEELKVCFFLGFAAKNNLALTSRAVHEGFAMPTATLVI
jgi:hypothetical protein